MLIDQMRPVEQSKIWELLRNFQNGDGPAEDRLATVPEGSTPDCRVADAYAAVVAAFLRDAKRQGFGRPPLIVELGAASGRFGWQFLQRLLTRHWHVEDGAPSFTYLLTDTSDESLRALEREQRFGGLQDKGLIEFGKLLVGGELDVRLNDRVMIPSDIQDRPVVFIANHLFGSLPNDLYRVRDGRLHRVLMTLESEDPAVLSGSPTTFETMRAKYDTQLIQAPETGVPLLDEIVAGYALKARNCSISAPRMGFQFLQRFMERDAPMLLLAHDRAYADPEEFPDKPPFEFSTYLGHYTNFHALAELFARNEGDVQFQRHNDPECCTGAFWVPGATSKDKQASMAETRSAARCNLEEFNFLDTNELLELLLESAGAVNYRQIFAWLRLASSDPLIAQSCLGLLLEAVHRSDEGLDRQQLYEVYMEAYTLYFPAGEPVTFDYGIAQLLLAIRYNKEALQLLESSIAEHGRKPERLYVYALVLIRMERMEEAKAILQEVLGLRSDFAPALRVFEEQFGNADAPAKLEAPHLSVSCRDADVVPKATAILEEHGAVWFKDMLPRKYIDEIREAFLETFEDWQKDEMGKPNFVGNKRYTVPMRIKAPFSDPSLFASRYLIEMLTEHMGDKPIIGAYGGVVTFPGANSQHVHREHPMLFARDEFNAGLPAHAVNVLYPLVDLDEKLGGTQLWEGTHKLGIEAKWEGDSTVVHAQKGDALVLDYRTFHGGMPCTADVMRPVLYITYCLPWFRDTLAFQSHDAVAISPGDLESMPEFYRDMFRFARVVPDRTD